MAYTEVPDVTTGDTWTADNHDTYIRDNFKAVFDGLAADELVKLDSAGTALITAGPAGMSLIAEHIVASDTEYLIEFSSIPATYRNLVVLFNGRIVDKDTGINGYIYARCNDDSGASNYRNEYFRIAIDSSISATMPSAEYNYARVIVGVLPTQNSPSPFNANYAFNAKLEIFNYRSVFYKNLSSFAHGFYSTTSTESVSSNCSAIWKSTDAINKISLCAHQYFTSGDDCFKTGSYFGLYGMA